ncbi:MAG: polyphenol oxidase family protein [Acidimicrobiales bacterium]|nr:polyphenol oxidase family protein [Acidimicrobiales bacterium]
MPRHRFTDTADGDFAVSGDSDLLTERRASVHPAPWTWLRQQHGSEVVVVTHAGEHAGAEADAAVTVVPDAPIAVQTADCAPVLLEGEGAVGVVHAGWRGLVAGVIEETAQTMTDLGHPPLRARLGPCIRARCYEFGVEEMSEVASRYGPKVVSTTAWGTPALDLAAAIRAACSWLEVPLHDVATCTACSSTHWSHRARGDVARQTLVAWLSDDVADPSAVAR